MKELFGNSCYAYCIAYLSGKSDIKDLTKDVLEGWYKGYIDDDGFVSKPHLFYNYCFGKNLAKDVKKIAVKDLDDLPADGFYIVELKQPNNKDSHFVVVSRIEGKTSLAFDPSGESASWKYQKPISWREFV